MSYWSIDLGTTNSSIARWNNETDSPELIRMDDICRDPDEGPEIDVRYCIPSCVYLTEKKRAADFVGALPFFRKYAFIGELALIGKAAREKDSFSSSPRFVNNFKPALSMDGFRTVSRFAGERYSAKHIGMLFLRELLRHAKKKTGERPKAVTFSVPVDSFETYRLHLKDISSRLGMHGCRMIDEPVAAAIGYGLGTDESRCALVIDFGGGTLDIAFVIFDEDKTERGRCTVVAKCGVPLGGNTVDEWILARFIQVMGYDIDRYSNDPHVLWWYRIMAEEASRLKEALFFKPNDTFYVVPPKELKRFEYLLAFPDAEKERAMPFSREDLVKLLDERGLYSTLMSAIEKVIGEAREKGVGERDAADVLMVGGSTLLPGVYPLVEERFGRDRVRAWQPFSAVAYGACAYSAGRLAKNDFIMHDYAFLTYTLDTHEPEYTIIIPKGTQFPTVRDFWKHRVVPTCPHGEPEKIFKLVICEIGTTHSIGQEFVWDARGTLHAVRKTDERNSRLVIPLNESNPTLGFLSPPHMPSDRTSRLEVSFTVNADRWLCTSVFDLKTRRHLMTDEPVCRLK